MFGCGSCLSLSLDPISCRIAAEPKIKGAIAVSGTNKMVMGFPAGCCFSWVPLLWSFGFLQLYRLGKKKGKKCREGEQREPSEIYSSWGRSFVLPAAAGEGCPVSFQLGRQKHLIIVFPFLADK